MWPSGSALNPGVVIDPKVSSCGFVPCGANPSNISRGGEEGARPKQLSPSSTPDCKSIYDSGYLSGSNLMISSSSIGCDEPCTNATNMMSEDDSGRGGDMEHHKSLHSSGHLDSGIDISEQLSSLHLASSSSSTTSSSLSSTLHANTSCSATLGEVDHHNTNTTRRTTSPPRKFGSGLNEDQLALLQEIFQRDEDGDTQLHVAVMRGFVEVVYRITRLLPHQAFLDLPNQTGRTALHLAVSASNIEVARHLIVCGATPVARDRRGNTPLHSASAQGDIRMVTQLTRPVTVAEVMAARLSYAPAHTPGLLAADLSNYDGQTCIHIASQGGHQGILQHLTWYGADINAKEGKSGRTALHYAVESRDQGLVAFLKESCRASLTLETYAGLTPYQLALANGASGIANLLLSLGAPNDVLPSYLTADDDLDYDDINGPVEVSNGFSMDDVVIGGVHMPLARPVSINDHTPFNLDCFF